MARSTDGCRKSSRRRSRAPTQESGSHEIGAARGSYEAGFVHVTPNQASQRRGDADCVCTSVGEQVRTIIVWTDSRSAIDTDIFAQRLDADGVPQWMAAGVVISTAAGNQRYVDVAPDGRGGAIVVWEDERKGTYAHDTDIYAQRVDATGHAIWRSNGLALCTAPNLQ